MRITKNLTKTEYKNSKKELNRSITLNSIQKMASPSLVFKKLWNSISDSVKTSHVLLITISKSSKLPTALKKKTLT